jgi:type IV secretory pathway VirB2 component (pilin)
MIKVISVASYSIALLSIVTAIVIGLLLIWGDRQNEALLYRLITTACLFLVASAIVLSLNGLFQKTR